MSADLTETIGQLRDLLFDIGRESQSTGYGVFPGGDPNTFTPDPEASTSEELERHRADCEKWNAGQRTGLTVTTCDLTQPVGRMMRAGYGLGVYTMEDPQAADWAERLERCIDQIESWATEEP